ncbi:MAG: hypothetical protein AAF653_14785, partial [Chloroflexota bacterium]
MKISYPWLVVVILLAIFATWVALPATRNYDFNNDGETDLTIEQPLGLDLVGGLRVLLEAELPPEAFTEEELRETANSVSRRVNALGLTEATVQVQGNTRILVEIPGVTDPERAISTIQETALLEFVNFSGLAGGQLTALDGANILTTEQNQVFEQRAITSDVPLETLVVDLAVNPNTGLPFETVMTGGGLAAAAAVFSQQSGWVIEFEVASDAQDIFGDYTGSNIGQPMAIVLDGEVLSFPTIQAALPTGGVISGNFTQEEAETLALQLRSGSLRIPLSVESTSQVGATLGQESVRLSIQAGIIGVIIVLAFMFIYYRALGIAADLALLVFIALNLALFKMIPV